MNDFCTVQVFQDHQWIDCATIELIGDQAKGWKASCATYYALDYAIEYIVYI